ncbi:hypothetical protein [Paenibacillus sp. SN-8-1]
MSFLQLVILVLLLILVILVILVMHFMLIDCPALIVTPLGSEQLF